MYIIIITKISTFFMRILEVLKTHLLTFTFKKVIYGSRSLDAIDVRIRHHITEKVQ